MTRDQYRIKVEADDLNGLPNVYEPCKAIRNNSHEFIVALPTELVVDLIEPRPKREHRAVWSPFRPRVVPGAKPVDQLVRELQILDAMNMSRDHVFAGERLIVTVRRYPYDLRGLKGFGLSLVSVEFDTNRAIEGAGS